MLLPQDQNTKSNKLRRAYLENKALVSQLKKEEDGAIVVLTLLLLISMLIVGGMAVDFMRLESERTRLQSVSDRAVLAAASLDQTRDPEQVITDFFQTAGYGGSIVGTPVVEPPRFYRRLFSSSQATLSNAFMFA